MRLAACDIALEVGIPVSEVIEPGVEENLERQNRFVADRQSARPRLDVQVSRGGRSTSAAAGGGERQSQFAFLQFPDSPVQPLDGSVRIATNTALDFLRRHSRVQYCELDVAPQTSGESPEQIVLRSEHHEYLADGLRLLSPRERTALLLRDVEGLPAEEVAKRLGCSKATVRSHIANARTKFRRYMERRKR